jgi:fructose-1,6-bisphosphatase
VSEPEPGGFVVTAAQINAAALIVSALWRIYGPDAKHVYAQTTDDTFFLLDRETHTTWRIERDGEVTQVNTGPHLKGL